VSNLNLPVAQATQAVPLHSLPTVHVLQIAEASWPPAGQVTVHSAAPIVDLSPAAQAVQAVLPAMLFVDSPAGHAVQSWVLFTAVNRPAGQSWQNGEPIDGECLPSIQSKQKPFAP